MNWPAPKSAPLLHRRRRNFRRPPRRSPRKRLRTDGWWQSQSANSSAGTACSSIDWLGADGDPRRPIDPADQARGDRLPRSTNSASPAPPRSSAQLWRDGRPAFRGAASGPRRRAGRDQRSRTARIPFTSAWRALQRQAVALGERLGATECGRRAGPASWRCSAIARPRNSPSASHALPQSSSDRVRVGAEDYLEPHGRAAQRTA